MRTSGLIAAFTLFGLAPAGRAEPAVTSPEDTSGSPILAPAKTNPPTAAASHPGHDHLVSGETAAHVTNGLPKFTAKPADGKPGAESVDLRDIDRPKNTIIRLPKYTLTKPRERKPPVFTERQLLTPQGLIDLTLKRHPGLKLGNFFGLNNGIALMMFAEQERLDNLADMRDVATNARNAGDAANAQAIADQLTLLQYRPSAIGGGR